MRAKLEGDKLVDAKEIFEAKAWNDAPGHFGARIQFDGQGPSLHVGRRPHGGLVPAHPERRDGSEPRRPPGAELGRAIRARSCGLNDDGSVPQDNPFVGRAGALPEIWSMRPPQSAGPVLRPQRRAFCGRPEHGPQGGDELNVIEKGKNYGWPVIGYGANYTLGTEIHASPHQGRHGAAEGVLRAVDRHLGPHDVHGRPVPELEGQPLRRRHGRQLPPARAVLDQRQGRDESRAAAARASTASATCAKARTASSTSPPDNQFPGQPSNIIRLEPNKQSAKRAAAKLDRQSLRSPPSRRAQRRLPRRSLPATAPASRGFIDSYFAALFANDAGKLRQARALASRTTAREEARRHVLGTALKRLVYRFDIVNTEPRRHRHANRHRQRRRQQDDAHGAAQGAERRDHRDRNDQSQPRRRRPALGSRSAQRPCRPTLTHSDPRRRARLVLRLDRRGRRLLARVPDQRHARLSRRATDARRAPLRERPADDGRRARRRVSIRRSAASTRAAS